MCITKDMIINSVYYPTLKMVKSLDYDSKRLTDQIKFKRNMKSYLRRRVYEQGMRRKLDKLKNLLVKSKG